MVTHTKLSPREETETGIVTYIFNALRWCGNEQRFVSRGVFAASDYKGAYFSSLTFHFLKSNPGPDDHNACLLLCLKGTCMVVCCGDIITTDHSVRCRICRGPLEHIYFVVCLAGVAWISHFRLAGHVFSDNTMK